jgi:hypothetical protein
MNRGSFDLTPSRHVETVFQRGHKFDLLDVPGSFDRDGLAKAYGQAIGDWMTSLGYDGVEIDVDGDRFRLTAFNPDGSSLDIEFRVNDRMGLEVVDLRGISVAHGNEVPLDWAFDDGMGFDGLEAFLDHFKNW